jgi:TonB family protein
MLAQSAWGATFVLLAAFAASWLLRTAPAAWRHFLWTAVLAGLLALPVMVRIAPKWGLPGSEAAPAVALPDRTVEAQTAVASTVVSTAMAKPAWNPLLPGWLAGCALAAAWFLAGRLRIWRMVRRAEEAVYARDLLDAAGGHGVRVLESASAPTALALGIWRPVVMLPAGAGKWPAERLHAALLHEWMHVRRRDLLAQAIAQAACCLYWFHPLAWMAARQLRREREQACDDAVLGRGMAAHDYAEHRVELVRMLRGRQCGAVTMAEPSDLEARVRALLDGGRDRRPLTRLVALAMIAALAVVLLPLAAVTLHARPAPPWHTAETISAPAAAPSAQAPTPVTGTLAGTVEDPTGARVPRCEVRAMNLDSSQVVTMRAGEAGLFRFDAIPVGRYSLEVRQAGFKVLKMQVLVEANQPADVTARLTVGEVSEVLTVTGARPSPAPAPAAAPAAAPLPGQRIRVGGHVQPAKIIAKVGPVYPQDLKAKGVTGTVTVRGVITKEGYLDHLEVVNTDVDPGLATAAMDAARHWLYQPSLLNGEPVAVLTSIEFRFELPQ